MRPASSASCQQRVLPAARPASSASSQQRERQRYGGGGGGGGMGKALVRGSCAHPGMLWPRLTDVGRRFFGNDCAHFKQKD
eukprot:1501390-Prorocentrum_lima.AAC.1